MKPFYDAWNRRDAAGVAAMFAPNGTYVDPISGAPVATDAIASHVSRFLGAFVDGQFAVRRTIEEPRQDGAVAMAIEWSLTARCDGAIDRELNAHGVDVHLEGVDLLELRGGKLTSVRRTFDRRMLADALGLQTIVEPIADGTMTFGYSVRDCVSDARPGALGMTWILARDEAEKAVIRALARQIIQHLRESPGFIGIVTGFAGLHGFTLTEWESEDALRQATQQGAHRDAMQAFHRGLSAGVFTSVWSPTRLNRIWTRCANGHANDGARRSCETCKAPLPARPPYL